MVREALEAAIRFVAEEMYKPCNHNIGDHRRLLLLLRGALRELDGADND